MAGATDPVRRPPGVAILAGLTLIGVLGVVLVVIGLGGAPGPGPTSSPGVLPSPVPSVPPSLVPSLLVSPPPASAPPTTSASLSPTSSPSVPPSAAPTDDPLLSGLLVGSDLPGLSSPLGPQEGSAFDIDEPAFEANGGIRVVSQDWLSLADSGLGAVYDFRMQFPTDAAATAYLDAAEVILAEAGTEGQSPVASPPVIGSDGRVYELRTTGDSGPVRFRTYLFRVGTVVAKLVAGGAGIEPTTTDALARTAADRILAAGPPVPGSPRPPATASLAPPSTLPLPTGEELVPLLLEHVPPHIVQGCVADPQRLWTGELATIVCTDDVTGVTVTYSGFESAAALEAAVDASLEGLDASALADSCDMGTFVGPYEVEGVEVGRVICWAEQGGQAIMWSDDRLAMLGVAASPTLDAAGLYLWWLDAGPVL